MSHLAVENISKTYGMIKANRSICFSVEKGEVLAILGENGAGKTTLMRMIYGLEKPDAGKILVNDQLANIQSPTDAIRLGIGMVHQHFMLVNNFTVAENLILGMREMTGPVLNMREMNQKVDAFFKQYKFDIDPKAIVGTLPVGLQQRVEIMKALFKGAEILVLDEPTAVLTPMEIKELMGIINQLRASGKSILFISHKLDEVMEVSQKVLVLRQGQVIGEVETAKTTKNELIKMMIGRELAVLRKDALDDSLTQKPVLSVKDLCVKGKNGRSLKKVSLDVWNHEVLAVAGVDGNGQVELVEAITGLKKVESGSISLNGQDITNLSVRAIRNHGLSHIPEDRRARGLVLSFSLIDNYILINHDRPPYAKGIFLRRKAAVEHAETLNKEYGVYCSGVSALASTLSGGNQQKVIVAREIDAQPDVLVAVKPTRGVDVGAIEHIHSCILKERDKNKAVLLVSSELDEIMELADRIVVMCNDEITGCVWADETSEKELGELMTGVSRKFTALEPRRGTTCAS